MADPHLEAPEASMAYLVGALADGSLYRNPKHYVHRVSYYQKEKDYLDHCIETRVVRLFNKKGHYYHDHRTGVYNYEITIKSVYLAIEAACKPFKNAANPSVPLWIKDGAESIKHAFIRGFFDAEGYFHLDKSRSDYRVRFGQANKVVLQDVRDMLCTELSCSAVLGPYKTKPEALPYYELHLYGIDQVRHFHELIKPCHPLKQLNELLESQGLQSTRKK
jgi:hypothetical protein